MGICLKTKAVFLDRDGVINRTIIKDGQPFPPSSLKKLEIIPNVLHSLNLLKEKDFILIVVTNQPDVGRGTQKKEIVEEINTYLLKNLPLDDFFVCWHGNDGDCNCRKPLSGLLLQAAKKFDIDFQKSYLIGDRWKDIDAGNAVGCKTIFINYKYKESLRSKPNFTTTSTEKAVDLILSQLD